jgi:hypothetical protein
VSCGITSGDGKTTVSNCRLVTPKSNQSRSKVAPKSLTCRLPASCALAAQATTSASQGVVPHDTTSDSLVDCSSFAALRPRRRQASSKQRAHESRQCSRESEQVAKQVASAQRRRGRRCGGDLWRGSHQSEQRSRQSEQVAKQVASAQPTSAHSSAAAPDTISVSSVVMRA